jgi:AraC-like DNA-binding protein
MAINYPSLKHMIAAKEYAKSGSPSKAASVAGLSPAYVSRLAHHNAQMRRLINDYREHFHKQLCAEAESVEVR